MRLKANNYFTILAFFGVGALMFCLGRALRLEDKPAPRNTISEVVNLGDNPLNENRLEEAIVIMMRGEGVNKRQEFEKSFSSFECQLLSEQYSFNSEPPRDYKNCNQINVLLIRKLDKIPLKLRIKMGLGLAEERNSKVTSWYLTAAFSKDEDLLQWWYIWGDD